MAIERALAPGVFIGYRGGWDFVEGLESVQAEIARLIEGGQAAGADPDETAGALVSWKQGDDYGYVALCEQEDGLAPGDCEVLAEMCLTRRRPVDALVWAERGLELEKKGQWPNGSAWRLPHLRRPRPGTDACGGRRPLLG